MELESQALALPMPRGEDAEMPDSLTLALAIDSSPPTSLPTDYDVSSPEWSVQLHQAADDSIPVNESIISLLLKLHSQLSGRLDSFSLDEPEPQSDEPIGDGPHFIGQVLRKLARLDARCAAAIDHKEERSRRARERQQQLMKEFQRRQQQFLHCMQRLSPEPMELDAPAPAPAPAPADYDCVICNTSSSTSVLGHRRRAGSGTASLALSERDRARLAEQRETTAASHYYRLHDDLQQNFDQESWLLSVSVGLEGGVHVASCGHHLHLRCLHAYLRSLAAPARPHNLHVAGGEFLCPSPSALSDAMNKAMEDMTETASSKLRQRYGSSPGAIFTFVTSLVRTNLECELVQRGGSLLTQEPPAAPQEPRPRYKPRNDCIVPLMVVAGAHAHVLSAAGALGVADTCAPRAECGSPAPPVPAPPAPVARPVPLLLRDPLALLLHLLLLAPAQPPHLQPQHFACIVHALYALSYYQIVQELLLPYLRVCALLRHHVYGAALPELPALLRLPRDYDRLFSYYHERVCLQCGAVPKEASVCLLCGTLVCLKQACCRSHQQAEAVQHANDCGGGTGIFLVVTSTYIIVIRGRRACLWGSLYLDDYDEEDRDLKRGKPLYLSGDRAELLQAQWLAHRFDHTKRTWVLGLYSFRCDAESGSEISIYTDDEFINTLSKPCFIHSKGKIIVFYTFRTIEQCYNIDYDYDYEFYKVSKVTPIFKFSYNKPCYETYLYTVYLL
ncbi:hypothetical protein MSG28_010027 [Choristoneura fumiferana]|uniref:Uncharacterized protein n=1 Tax=Choristoneura fumiferana TaxID=7141 RepID=A0ACC0KJ03_CHOFU|nr:hypothetical protein MSG28_010027 [Choristoneura fumiferana]